MPTSTRFSSLGNFVVRYLASAVLLAILAVEAAAQPSPLGDAARFIPPGASITDPTRHTILEDLDRDGTAEAVIFYQRGQDVRTAGLVVLRKKGDGYQQIWSRKQDHSLGAIDPSGVRNLTGASTPQIVAFWGIGASCQGSLDIFRYRQGQFESIAGPWKETGCQNAPQFEDLDNDGLPEVIFKVHRNTAVPHIYRWNGEGYLLDRERFPDYYQEGLQQMSAVALGAGEFPATARVSWGSDAAEILLIQKRPAAAIDFYKKLLLVLDDPKLSTSNSIEAQPGSHAFESDIARAKAKLYRQMSRIATIAGGLLEAAEFQWEAERIESRLAN